MRTPDLNQSCADYFTRALANPRPPYTLYSPSVSSTHYTTNTCDVSIYPDGEECYTLMAVHFATNFVQTTQTVHGISKLDIWLNIGAIVGAVQFFAYFLQGG